MLGDISFLLHGYLIFSVNVMTSFTIYLSLDSCSYHPLAGLDR